MKKLLTLISVSVFLLTSGNSQEIAQANKEGITDMAKINLEAMRNISRCFELKDFSNLGEYIAIDAVDHAGERSVRVF